MDARAASSVACVYMRSRGGRGSPPRGLRRASSPRRRAFRFSSPACSGAAVPRTGTRRAAAAAASAPRSRRTPEKARPPPPGRKQRGSSGEEAAHATAGEEAARERRRGKRARRFGYLLRAVSSDFAWLFERVFEWSMASRAVRNVRVVERAIPDGLARRRHVHHTTDRPTDRPT